MGDLHFSNWVRLVVFTFDRITEFYELRFTNEDLRWPSRSSRDSHKKRGRIWFDLVGFTWIFANSLGFLQIFRWQVDLPLRNPPLVGRESSRAVPPIGSCCRSSADT